MRKVQENGLYIEAKGDKIDRFGLEVRTLEQKRRENRLKVIK